MNNSSERRRHSFLGWFIAVVAVGLAVWMVLAAWPHEPPDTGSLCLSNMRRLAMAMLGYTNDWGKYPTLRSSRPSVPRGEGWPDAMMVYMRDKSYLHCPKSSGDRLTYAFNRRLSNVSWYAPAVLRPSKTVALYETVNGRRENNNLNGDVARSYRHGGIPRAGDCVVWDGPVAKYTEGWPDWAKPRHEGSTNVALADGHVMSLRRGIMLSFDPKAKEGAK